MLSFFASSSTLHSPSTILLNLMAIIIIESQLLCLLVNPRSVPVVSGNGQQASCSGRKDGKVGLDTDY
jgi:hypothetical protein